MPSRFEDERIHDFYERFNRELRRMPEAHRHETQIELRQHLDELLAAHEEAGLSESEAIESALRQFGDPARLGREMMGEWRKTQDSPLFAFIYAFACIAGAITANLALMVIVGIPCAIFQQWELLDACIGALGYLSAASIILVAGPMVGKRLGRNAVKGMAQASIIGFVSFVLLCNIPGHRMPASGSELGQLLFVAFYVFANAIVMAYAFSNGGKDPRKRDDRLPQ